MQHDRKTLEDALIDVEVSNTHAIALGRRFFTLQQEAKRIRDEIARVNARCSELSNAVQPTRDVVEPTEDVNPAPSFRHPDRHPVAELKTYLDSVNGRDFLDGMEWSRKAGTALSLAGWAYLSVSEPPLISVTIRVVGPTSEAQGLAQRTIRQDVADHFGRPDIAFCGFSAEISLFSVQDASVELRIEARDGDDVIHTHALGTLNLTQ